MQNPPRYLLSREFPETKTKLFVISLMSNRIGLICDSELVMGTRELVKEEKKKCICNFECAL
jgi:hypothetical protein